MLPKNGYFYAYNRRHSSGNRHTSVFSVTRVSPFFYSRCAIKWFKHIVGSLHDPDIRMLIRKYGIEGYGFYFALIEMMCQEFDVENPGIVTFEISHLAECFRYKRATLLERTEFVANNFQKKRLTIEECTDTHITLNSYKLKGLADNWTERLLRSGSVVAPSQEVEVEVEEETKKKCIKKKFLERVFLKPEEHEKLIADYGEETITEFIRRLDEWIGIKNPGYKDHYLVIRKWLRKDGVLPQGEVCPTCKQPCKQTDKVCEHCGRKLK